MKSDRGSSVFWLLLSLAVMSQARRLGLGSVHEPGAGFLSFWAALLLAALSLALLVRSVLRKPCADEPLFRGKYWVRVVLVLAAVFAYASTIELGGYLLTTFLLMSFLFWLLERRKIWHALAYAAGTTLATYFVFAKCLNCQFPAGPFGY